MKTNVWIKLLAPLVAMGGLLGLTSCNRIVTSMAGLSGLMVVGNTQSARSLNEKERITIDHALTAVKEVTLSTNLDCHLYQSKEAHLEVIAPNDERLQDLHYEVQGDRLIIYDKKIKAQGKLDSANINYHLAINLYLPEVKDINLSGACALEVKTDLSPHKLSIDCSGASSITAGKVSCSDLNLDLSGAVACTMKDIEAKRVTADLSGAVALTLSGQTESLIGDFSGAVNADLKDLKSYTAKVEASGACSVKIYASESLTCDASGVVSLSYAGNPKETKIEKSGMSSVHKH